MISAPISTATDVPEAARHTDLLVVGAGLFGLTVAEVTARTLGRRVLVIDRRRHPGGTAWSGVDPDTAIEVHRYGSHILHTSNDRVWDYIQRCTAIAPYRHTVWSRYRGNCYPLPATSALSAGSSAGRSPLNRLGR